MIDFLIFFGFVFLVVLVVVVLFGLVGAKEVQELRLKLEEGENRRVFVTNYDRSFIVIDYEKNIIEVGSDKIVNNTGNYIEPHHWKFDFSKLRSVEAQLDEKTVIKTDRGSQLIGGAVGLVALGGVGAIIGGLSGVRRSDDRLKSVALLMRFDDTENPFYRLTFFKAADQVNGDDPALAEMYMKDFEQLEALLANIVAKNASPSSSGLNGDNIATTLSNLAELHARGALSDFEFEQAKKAALGETKGASS